ncbi:hypothetical protein RFI_24198 [Reticulomyxa filosa]|uniref:Kinesin motor domain-containing protein n=1 Tax=Reticulomyxa filosa TaxID=46433 RepID=X6MHM1_RETFI|nr:hypothetical protein RFI_24198 [Reticulomyxa filosa]|eukprot:ETO13176.1 hypothetical protein RFI_24198 [Reticulomyxa filosa]
MKRSESGDKSFSFDYVFEQKAPQKKTNKQKKKKKRVDIVLVINFPRTFFFFLHHKFFFLKKKGLNVRVKCKNLRRKKKKKSKERNEINVTVKQGSGKTYTMGTTGCDDSKLQEEWGIIPSSIYHMFAYLKRQYNTNNNNSDHYSISCSFIEIYNEEIKDLLDRTRSKS